MTNKLPAHDRLVTARALKRSLLFLWTQVGSRVSRNVFRCTY